MSILKIYPRHSIRMNLSTFAIAMRQLLAKNFINEKNIETFEQEFASYIGINYAVTVPSCRVGIYLGLKNSGFLERDEVIMSAYTFKGVLFAVKAAGLKPVFVDINDNDCNIDESAIEEKITKRTKAILISHMYGVPCAMDKIVDIASRHNLDIIEDVALACGAEYKNKKIGSFGKFGVFSFGMGKNLSCFGGGMVTTDDLHLYNVLKQETMRFPFPRRYQAFLKVAKYFVFYMLTSDPIFKFITFPIIFIASIFNKKYFDNAFEENVTLEKFKDSIRNCHGYTPLQAVIGMHQLKTLDAYNKRISDNAAEYDRLLPDNIRLKNRFKHSNINSTRYHYIIRARDTFRFRKSLHFCGIDTQPDDMSDCSALNGHSEGDSTYLNTVKALKEIIEIPNNVKLKEKDLRYISGVIKKYLLI